MSLPIQTREVATTTPTYDPLFDADGNITQRFERQLNLVMGIVAKPARGIFSTDLYYAIEANQLLQNHVIGVNQLLQNKGCTKRYKWLQGETSDFKMNYELAEAFLADEYRDHKMIMPREKKIRNAIFLTGDEAVMYKEFHSLQESIKQGFKYHTIYFITQNAQTKEKDEKLINANYRGLLDGIEIRFIIADIEGHRNDIFDKGLNILSSHLQAKDDYVIITNPITNSIFDPNVEAMASSVLKEQKCLGIASAPIDWTVDMKLSGYETALGSHEKATIAWASHLWSLKALEVFIDMRAWQYKRPWPPKFSLA
jgi:hypothetical protein